MEHAVDDIVLMDKTWEGVNARLEVWREALKTKGFKLGKSKTEYVECKFRDDGEDSDMGVTIGTQEVPKKDEFKYLGSRI